MVNVQGAAIVLWGFPAMLAYLIAFPYLVGTLEPKSIINRVGILTEILTDKVVNIFATITDIATFDRAINSLGLFNRFPAYLTWFSRVHPRLAVEFITAWLRACFWCNTKCWSVEHVAANNTGVILFLRFAIARTRTKLRDGSPFFHGYGWAFEKDFTTLVAAF